MVTGAAGPLVVVVVEGADGVPLPDVEAPPDVCAGCVAEELVELDVEGAAEEEVPDEPPAGAPGLPIAVGLCCAEVAEAAVPADPPLSHIVVPAVTNPTATTAEPMATPVVEPTRRPARCPLSRMS
jgi:hypothetical protein